MLSKNFVSKYKKALTQEFQKKNLLYVIFLGLRKIFDIKKIILYPMSLLLCILIRLIKPIIFIRFGSLYVEKIGPFSAQPELNLCEQENGIQPKNTFNIYHSGNNQYPCCNNQLFKMWKRILYVNEASKYLYNVMDAFKFGKEHIIRTTNDSRDIHGLLETTPIHLKFLPEEIDQANLELLKMGISKNDKYVLMINRGQRYLDYAHPEIDFGYHTYRNCNIDKFMLMAEELTKRGYFVIRVGHLVSDLMNTDNPKIIEYDHSGFRTELLDIYLGSTCRYLVGSDTGYFGVPGWIFRKPVVYVNFSQFEYLEPWLSSWLLIFRKLWLKKEERFMTVQEILESGAGRLGRTEQFEKMGIEVSDNTPEEILDVVNEMEERLKGTWQATEEDEELQKQFWSHFNNSNLHGVIRSRIGAKFLRENKDLL